MQWPAQEQDDDADADVAFPATDVRSVVGVSAVDVADDGAEDAGDEAGGLLFPGPAPAPPPPAAAQRLEASPTGYVFWLQFWLAWSYRGVAGREWWVSYPGESLGVGGEKGGGIRTIHGQADGRVVDDFLGAAWEGVFAVGLGFSACLRVRAGPEVDVEFLGAVPVRGWGGG